MEARLGKRNIRTDSDDVPWSEVVEEAADQARPLRPWLRGSKAIPDCMLDPMRSGQRPTGSYLGTGESIIEAQNRRDYLGGTLTEAEWARLREAFDDKCAYCQRSRRGGVLIEHVHPISLGGRTNVDNVVPACRDCNANKGRKTLEQWRGAEWVAVFRQRWAKALDGVKKKAG